MTTRVGFGYDVHAFVQGPPLILGGVTIPYDYGLSGHSDADTIIHAVVDALLGAAALGDIGTHFPSSDMRWKDQPGAVFLGYTYDLLCQQQWHISNIDATIVAERPRMAPHIQAMRTHLAEHLHLDREQVSVKATTTDGLGFAGRQEGIACYAVVLIEDSAAVVKEEKMADSTLRQRLVERLGHFPERVPLATAFGPTVDLSDHIRMLVTYAVEPGERIQAWLLYPKGTPPLHGWPGMLAMHQHAGQYDLGKSEPAGISGDAMYHYGLDLCRRGYVVLCPDHLCFEDRRPPEEVRVANNGTLNNQGYEQFEFTRRILAGSCLQTKYLHDLVCALDLLAALPDVNSARLGAIGHSLGGQETLWLTWYDPRVKAAISSCGFGLLQTILRDGINHNLAMYVPGMLEISDIDALVAAIAPRAFLLTAGETDPLFPIDGVRSLVTTAQNTYAQKNVPERFRAIIFPRGHSFPDDVKAEAYAFLDRRLT